MSKSVNVVLVIDDEPKIRRFLRAGFELHSFEVHEAENAAEGLKVATFNAPDLIVLDGAIHRADVAIGLAKGHPAALAYLRNFVEGAKTSGLLRRAFDDAGLKDLAIAGASP